MKSLKAYDLYPSTISPLITQERMEQERLNLTEPEFRQKYLGEFVEQVDTYLPLDLITPCVDLVVERETADVVDRLRARGVLVDYLVFEDEGHDVIKLKNRVTCYNRIKSFFTQHLKA